MKKLFAVLAATAAIGIATPVMAEGINVRIGDGGMHRHHRSAVIVHRPRHVVVVREHRNWEHRNWHHANRGAAIVVR